MITCNLMGGLGNQLFQIFTTINYSLLSRNPFKFSNIKTLGAGTTTVRYTYWDTFLIKLKPFLFLSLNSKIDLIKEKDYTYHEINIHEITNRDVCLFGYFQSYKYFEKNFEVICKLLNIHNIKNSIKSKLDYNSEFYNQSVSMHFRLGDYKKMQDYHPIQPYQYYKNSVNHILNNDCNIENILYFYEEDDLEDVDIMIEKLQVDFNINKIKFIRINSDLQDWEQMLIMSCCKHNIIANSTFSWWGAYLNTNRFKIVCYPHKWFGILAKNNTKDLFPPSWIKIFY